MSDFTNAEHVEHPDREPILDEEGRCLRCLVSYLEARVEKVVDSRIRATVEQVDPTKGNVIVLKGWDWLGEEIPKMFEAIRYAWGVEEAERDRLTLIELAGDATIESLDDEEMGRVGWIRKPVDWPDVWIAYRREGWSNDLVLGLGFSEQAAKKICESDARSRDQAPADFEIDYRVGRATVRR